MTVRDLWTGLLAVALAVGLGCGGSGSSGGSNGGGAAGSGKKAGSGGKTGSAGMSGKGGASGASGTGGSSGSAGASGSGGSSGAGGSAGTGGSSASGGTSGTSGSGGTGGSGGTSGGGGTSGSGGTGGSGGSGGSGVDDREWSLWSTLADGPTSSAYMTTADTVTDGTTGLVWQRTVPTQMYNWADAKTYCENLSLAGMTGWSLPTLVELESILDYTTYNPTINATAFPSTPGEYFWASSSDAAGTGNGWTVHFGTGNTGPINSFSARRARCVKSPTMLKTGSPGAPAGRYTTSADVVTDTTTNLKWQRSVPGTSYTWADATTYCQGLSLGGLTSWRLPSMKELQSLVDVRATNPAIDATAFPGTPAETFWSSAPDTGRADFVYCADFTSGLTQFYGSGSTTYRVRCVK